MEIRFFKNFSKRINSLKIPSDASGTLMDVKMKEGTSIEEPVFMIRGIDLDYNYCKWNNHYYYVKDITLSNNNIFEVACTQDKLASHRTAILASTQFVKYSASRYDKYLADTRIPNNGTFRSGNYSIDMTTLIPNWNRTAGQNTEVILTNATSDVSSSTLGTGCWIMNMNNLVTYINFIMSPEDDLLTKIKKYVDNVACSTINVKALPLTKTYTASTSGVTDVTVFGDSSHAKGFVSYQNTNNITVVHTETLTPLFNDYRDYDTNVEVFLPFYGYVTFKGSDIFRSSGGNSITFTINIDIINGIMSYDLLGINQLGHYECNIGIDINVVGKDYNQTALNLTSSFASGAMSLGGNILQSAIHPTAAISGGINTASMFAQSVTNMIQSAQAQSIRVSGGNKTTDYWKSAIAGDNIYITVYSRNYSTELNAIKNVRGILLEQPVALNTLSGYCQCENASVDLDSLSDDKDIINNYLNGGVFIE